MKAPSKADRPRIQGNIKLWVLLGLAVIFLALAVAAFNYPIVKRTHNRQALRMVTEMEVMTPAILSASQDAVFNGKAQGFEKLTQARSQMEGLMRKLGNANTGIGSLSSTLVPDLKQVSDRWAILHKNLDQIIVQRKSITEITDYSNRIITYLPQLLDLSDKVTKHLLATGGKPQEVYLSERQSTLVLLIENDLTRLRTGQDEEVQTASTKFKSDIDLFGQVLQGLLTGDKGLGIEPVRDAQARAALRQMAMIFSGMGEQVGAVVKLLPDLYQAKLATDGLPAASATMLASLRVLSSSMLTYGQGLRNYTYAGFALVLMSALTLLTLGAMLFSDKKRELALTNEQNRRNQRAILRLLDEMTNLAEGDLTVHATVTEDITGAIADSVNYAIDALRSLVTTINQTAVQVAAASEKTQSTALRLADASNHQAREIASTSAAVSDMADSIERVAANAMDSAEVAKKSVEIAAKGAATVRRSIDGMDTIREQIQDTSKRIKRLGESSQEIGDIVGLINDIADQTNILALNAAIQASAAGEAGRGFAVVADEVQRLAERSANATRQIEALVKTIQADTNEAVYSMERSTSNVVSGGQLAVDAGEALAEIENVSNQLAKQIMGIASSARQQAAVAANVTNTMNVIQEITMQTSEGTNETAQSIGQLTALAAELRTSVAGFKLPDSDDEATFVLENESDEVAA